MNTQTETASSLFSQEVAENFLHNLLNRGESIFFALVIAAVGFAICRWVRSVIHRVLLRSKVEHSAVAFITESVYYMMLLIVFLAALGTMGVSTTTLAATLGGVGLGIGLALKDKASNVASGIFVLLFHPYRIGDYITVSGYSGTVRTIRIMYTELLTLGNQIVVVPNSTATAAVIVNYSVLDTRNIEFEIGVGYGTNLTDCVRIMKETFLASPYVHDANSLKIYVQNLGDSAITVYARVPVDRADYFDARHALYIDVKTALDNAGIDIPYPQLVVHRKET